MRSNIKIIVLLLMFFISVETYAQGIINNGGQIVFSNNSHLTIVNANGHYTSTNGGIIRNNINGGTISVQGNWVNNSPNMGFVNDGISVNLNGNAQNIEGTNTTLFYHLNLLGTGMKTLNINTSVGGISNLTGVLNLNNIALDLNQHLLTISNPSPTGISRTTGYVISETNAATNPSIMGWNTGANTGTYVFPFGTTSNYIPVTIDKTSSTESNVSVSTRSTMTDNNQPWTTGVSNMISGELSLEDASKETVIDRWWEIQTSNPIVANLTLSYQGTENTTTLSPLGTFAMQRWDGFWGNQQGAGVGVTSGVGSVTANNLTDFSTFVLSTMNNYGPLPITLTRFNATCEGELVRIEWETATEINSSHFIIERSVDGITWEIIKQVESIGNSNTTKQYSIIDISKGGISYYRLRQIDIDGKEEVFKIIAASCGNNFSYTNVYPNPTNKEFILTVSHSHLIADGLLQLLDITGKLIESRTVSFLPGENQFLFSTQRLAKGTYVLNVISIDKRESIKVAVF
ncbi:MAG: T9SS type A sorting domain-containing protein [Chitinophagales bacterium]|nr:T9SS type A sorting domain-containing protein [Chitinophagales bacterium]